MNPLFVNRSENENHEDDLRQETSQFFTLYLFFEWSCSYCWISYYFPIWNDRNVWDENMTLIFANLFSGTDAVETYEKMMERSAQVRQFKARKFKTKQDLLYINGYNSYLQKMKKNCQNNLELLFRRSGIWGWLDFIDETTMIPMGFDTPDMIKDNEEDPLINNLLDELTDDLGLLMLNYDANNFLKAISIDKPNVPVPGSEIQCFFNIPFFSFPFCNDLEKEKMKALRASLLPKMKNIATLTDKLCTEAKNEEFNSGLEEKCRSIYTQMQPDLQIIQKQIDNELYFQQRKHISGEYTLLTLNLCVASIKTIIDYYEQSKTLLPYAATALKRQLELKTDINHCCVFLNLTSKVEKSFE